LDEVEFFIPTAPLPGSAMYGDSRALKHRTGDAGATARQLE
jgi:hypothetical protein